MSWPDRDSPSDRSPIVPGQVNSSLVFSPWDVKFDKFKFYSKCMCLQLLVRWRGDERKLEGVCLQ